MDFTLKEFSNQSNANDEMTLFKTYNKEYLNLLF